MRVVVTLGGIRYCAGGGPMTAESHGENARLTGDRLMPITAIRTLIVSHGNGPQVRLLAPEETADGKPVNHGAHPRANKAVHLATPCH